MVSRRDDRHNIGFLSAFLGLIIAPLETTETLLTMPRPKYGLGVLVLMLATIYIPVYLCYRNMRQDLYEPKFLVGATIVLVIMVVAFTILELFLLKVMRVKIHIGRLTHSICYCLAPLTVTLWVMYLINYIANGNVYYLTFTLTGMAAENPKALQAVSWTLWVGFPLAFIVFVCALKNIGDLFVTNALILGGISLVPLFAAFLIAVIVADAIQPGTLEVIKNMLVQPTSALR